MYQKAVIIDDHQLFASALATVLKETNKFKAVSYTSKMEEMRQWLATGEVSHLFLDYLMPGVSTLGEITKIKEEHPGILIIIVSSVMNANLIFQMHKAGADSFISKNSDRQELDTCFSLLEKKQFFVSSDIHEGMMDLFVQGKTGSLFTAREHELLQHIASGATIEEMAEKLFLSKHTIVSHRRNMMAKLGVNSISALLKKAMDMGLL